jgi:hypothetical protein
MISKLENSPFKVSPTIKEKGAIKLNSPHTNVFGYKNPVPDKIAFDESDTLKTTGACCKNSGNEISL